MSRSISQIQSPRAGHYLKQMCQHFGNKVPVEFDDSHGTIILPFGNCTLHAQEDILTLTISGTDTKKLEKIIGSHLERFAFRDVLTVTWERTAQPMGATS